MGKHNIPDFIVIDDDFINNVICETIIQSVLPEAKIDIFIHPQKGLEYLVALKSVHSPNNVVLYLDINMPEIDGWDVLDMLKDYMEWVKQHLRIFIFSSSLTQEDKQKATDNPLISGYIEKPLKPTDLQNMFENSELIHQTSV